MFRSAHFLHFAERAPKAQVGAILRGGVGAAAASVAEAKAERLVTAARTEAATRTATEVFATTTLAAEAGTAAEEAAAAAVEEAAATAVEEAAAAAVEEAAATAVEEAVAAAVEEEAATAVEEAVAAAVEEEAATAVEEAVAAAVEEAAATAVEEAVATAVEEEAATAVEEAVAAVVATAAGENTEDSVGVADGGGNLCGSAAAALRRRAPSTRTDSDEDFLPPTRAVDTGYNDDKLHYTALAADRYGVSSRVTAAIVNAFQQDIGRVTPEDASLVVAPMKVWRARSRVRAEAVQEAATAASSAPMQSLYFDGRKDKTAVSSSSSVREEHVVVLREPGAEYITHFTPQSGRATDLFKELHAVALQFGADIRALGCDGTAVNTGIRGGVCRLFETFTGQPVHWFICQLHANELNLRSVFQVSTYL